MKYFSIFSGIGGFELGIERAFLYKSKTKQLQTKQNICGDNSIELQRISYCGYSEIDKYAIQIYQKHFKEHKNYGDARRIVWERVPDFDMLCGGFPCQAFSIAGKRGGFEDTRGTLFYEIAKCVRIKRPQLLFLENVKGLLSHDSGRTFGTILATLSDLGYILEWQVLNSKDFGVPQNRERVFIIGHLGKGCGQQVFPLGKTSGESNLKYIGAIMSKQNKQWLKDGKKLSRNFPQGQRVYSTNGIASNICGDAGGLGGKTGLYATLTPDRSYKRQHGRRFKKDGEPMFTLTGQDIHGISNGTQIRRLTPTECERLQGFPDGWTEGISDTQRYKCLGNAVTVNVIEAIIKKIMNKSGEYNYIIL